MSSVRRSWILVATVAAVATLVALGAAAGVARLRSSLAQPALSPFAPLPIPRIDVRERIEPRALDRTLRLLDRQGIGAVVNFTGSSAGPLLDAQLEAASKQPGRVRVTMGLDRAGCCGAAWGAREAARLAAGRDAGVAALDLELEGEARPPLNGPELQPIWEACARAGLVVAAEVSSADDEERLERVASRWPGLSFLLPHLGAPGSPLGEAGRLLDRHPNLYLDLSGRLADLSADRSAARALLLAHRDRILFATGIAVEAAGAGLDVLGAGRTEAELQAFFSGQYRFLETRDGPFDLPGAGSLVGLGLPWEVLERIYHRNAERLFGFEPEAQ